MDLWFPAVVLQTLANMADLIGKKGKACVAIITTTIEEFAVVQNLFGLNSNIDHTPYFVRAKERSPYRVVARRSLSQTNVISHRTAGEVIEDFFPEFLFLVGTAGGCTGRDPLTLGDVVIADYVEYSGYWKFRDGQILERKVPFDHPSLYLHQNYVERLRVQPAEWRQHISVPRPDAGEPHIRVGSVISSDILMGDIGNDFQRRVIEHFDKAIAVEMEAYGIASAVFESRVSVDYNPQFLVIRGISDYANADPGDNQDVRVRWTEYAVSSAASVAFAIADLLARRPRPSFLEKLLGRKARG